MQQPSEEKLFSDFPEVSKEEWKKKILEDLKDADYEERLVWHTQEGFDISPFYCAEDLHHLKHHDGKPAGSPYGRSTKKVFNNWEIRQDICVNNPEIDNKTALDILQKGVTSLGLKFDTGVIDSGAKFSRLLKDIRLDGITLNLLTGKHSLLVLEYLIDEVSRRNFNAKALKGSFDFDPIGNLTVNGDFYHNPEDDFQDLKNLIEKAADALPSYKVLQVNGLNFNNAGAGIVLELALTLSVGSEYLARLSDLGLDIHNIISRMQFVFGIGSNYFLEIAKFRAARLLWAKIAGAYEHAGTDTAEMFIHAVTTQWNRTSYDPYVNMLRSATESMSAILGGADSLEIKPFDSAYAIDSEFSLRNARNIQIIIKEEAYFDKVIDPAAGSYYIENITLGIMHHAWKLFLEIEEKGGYIEAFKKGFVQEIIQKTANKRLNDIEAGNEVLVGTNKYIDPDEKVNDSITLSDKAIIKPEGKFAQPVRLLRGASDYEIKRMKREL